MGYRRHTMGQDWGGRKKLNPEDCPKVTSQQVAALAQDAGVEIFRGGFLADGSSYQEPHGTWWYKDREGTWRTLGMTNYLAICLIREFMNEQHSD